MSVVPVSYYLVLSAILFGLGVFAFVFKRNIITIFMAIELMLNAVNLAFVAFAARMESGRRARVRFLCDCGCGGGGGSGIGYRDDDRA